METASLNTSLPGTVRDHCRYIPQRYTYEDPCRLSLTFQLCTYDCSPDACWDCGPHECALACNTTEGSSSAPLEGDKICFNKEVI